MNPVILCKSMLKSCRFSFPHRGRNGQPHGIYCYIFKFLMISVSSAGIPCGQVVHMFNIWLLRHLGNAFDRFVGDGPRNGAVVIWATRSGHTLQFKSARAPEANGTWIAIGGLDATSTPLVSAGVQSTYAQQRSYALCLPDGTVRVMRNGISYRLHRARGEFTHNHSIMFAVLRHQIRGILNGHFRYLNWRYHM